MTVADNNCRPSRFSTCDTNKRTDSPTLRRTDDFGATRQKSFNAVGSQSINTETLLVVDPGPNAVLRTTPGAVYSHRKNRFHRFNDSPAQEARNKRRPDGIPQNRYRRFNAYNRHRSFEPHPLTDSRPQTASPPRFVAGHPAIKHEISQPLQTIFFPKEFRSARFSLIKEPRSTWKWQVEHPGILGGRGRNGWEIC